MSDYQNDVESRPRDESFDVDPTFIKRGETEKKNYREKPGVVMAILGCGVVLTAVAVLLYYGLQSMQYTIIPEADSTMNRETYETISSVEEEQEHSATGISEKTRASEPSKSTEKTKKGDSGKKTTESEDSSETEKSSTEEDSRTKTSDISESSGSEPDTESVSPETPPSDTPAPEPPVAEDTSETENRNVIRTSSDLSGDFQDVLYEGLVYRVQNREATVVQNACPNTRIEVAPDVYGYPVIGIDDDAFRGSVNASLIVIPEGIDWISSGAFAECPNLVQVVIPDSVSGISEDAFGTNLGVTIMSSPGTYAHNFAINKGMNWIEKTGQE